MCPWFPAALEKQKVKETRRRDIVSVMSSDEDFSLVMEKPSEDTVEGVRALIHNYKEKHAQLLQEQKELTAATKDHEDMTLKYQRRSERLAQTMEEEERGAKEHLSKEMENVDLLKREELELLEELRTVEAALEEERVQNSSLREKCEVFGNVPERKVVFTGKTKKAGGAESMFEMKSRIVYPMDGGTALITFEKEVVAQRILSVKKHRVNLVEECFIDVETRPLYLLMPSVVKIDSNVCPQRILISNLPEMDTDTLLTKLALHFHRSRNGGGEVDNYQFLSDSGTVVLEFVHPNIASGLAEKEFHDVELKDNKKHKVKVSPFLNGNVTTFEPKMVPCARTVLVTGIPVVMERDVLQDMLEIHFQKKLNGGGEIEAIYYNPLGQTASALFESVKPGEEEQ